MKTTYPDWIHDESPIEDTFGYGERAVRVLRTIFKHPKTGKPLQIDPWMERIVRRIYGPCHPNGERIVRNVVMMIPRGGRKTSLGAALALLHTVGPEKVIGGQVILAAYDRDQARIAFEEASGIVRADRRLAARVKMLDSRHRLTNKATRTRLQAVSSDANARNGATPAFVLFDEVHCWKQRGLYDVLRTGLGKTANTLSVTISQAGRGTENVAFEIFDYARKVARGEIHDPGTLPILLETPPDADWQDEAVWHRVNPGLAIGYPNIDALRQEALEAQHRPPMREKFKNDHLNIWLDHSADPFVDMATYDRGGAPIDARTLIGQPCWIGVDMATVGDLTAVVACFKPSEESYLVVPKFFLPGDGLRERGERDGVPYVQWAEDGFLTVTDGNALDYRAVEQYIRDIASMYQVNGIGFDQAYAQPVMGPLTDDKFPVITMQLGWITQSPALNKLERAIVGGKFQHGGNPILRWNFENVAIRTDAAGNRTMHKGLSHGDRNRRIDGAFATWMALELASVGVDMRSIYSTPARSKGLLIL